MDKLITRYEIDGQTTLLRKVDPFTLPTIGSKEHFYGYLIGVEIACNDLFGTEQMDYAYRQQTEQAFVMLAHFENRSWIIPCKDLFFLLAQEAGGCCWQLHNCDSSCGKYYIEYCFKKNQWFVSLP